MKEDDMTRQELRVFLSEWTCCGCGLPETAWARLCDILALHPLYDHLGEIDALIPDDGVRYLLLYALDHFDLTEHGGSVGGAWLTVKGAAVLEALQREAADGFEALTVMHCMHGYAVEDELDQCADCRALNAGPSEVKPADVSAPSTD